jgi:hypothetical protein
MYAIISDWMPFVTKAETETPIQHPAKGSNANRREEEFRTALDSYIADYRKHRAMIANRSRHQIL